MGLTPARAGRHVRRMDEHAPPVRLARRVFRIAGIYGLIVLLPLFFAEGMIARYAPPGLTHPEYYYGFLGAASAWQLVYLTIAGDPIRYRRLMPIAVLAKLSFSATVAILFGAGRLDPASLSLPAVDLLLGIAFAIAWLRFRKVPG